ncbi:hypothetical protein [Yinghuangia soli]|uniref:hypothetical protein n=1 Tax=Yinghuangia soli TaxID=2908204 RepID=UPI0027E3101D|nr:hypothetical protein [Yinghuangia soli]
MQCIRSSERCSYNAASKAATTPSGSAERAHADSTTLAGSVACNPTNREAISVTSPTRADGANMCRTPTRLRRSAALIRICAA